MTLLVGTSRINDCRLLNTFLETHDIYEFKLADKSQSLETEQNFFVAAIVCGDTHDLAMMMPFLMAPWAGNPHRMGVSFKAAWAKPLKKTRCGIGNPGIWNQARKEVKKPTKNRVCLGTPVVTNKLNFLQGIYRICFLCHTCGDVGARARRDFLPDNLCLKMGRRGQKVRKDLMEEIFKFATPFARYQQGIFLCSRRFKKNQCAVFLNEEKRTKAIPKTFLVLRLPLPTCLAFWQANAIL